MNVLRTFFNGTLHLLELRRERSVLIGRRAGADLVIDLDGIPEVAAAIRYVGGGFRLIPLSDAALRVNGQPVTSLAGAEIRPASHITIGGHVLIEVGSVPTAEELRTARAKVPGLTPPRGMVAALQMAPPTAEALPELELRDGDLVTIGESAVAANDGDAEEVTGVHRIPSAWLEEIEESPTEARVAG